NGGETPFLTEAEIDEIILKVNGINLDLTNDLQEVYTAVKELLEVQNMNAWMTIADNPGVIGTFDENQQNLITSALTRIATLDLVKLGDVALEVGIYQQAVLDQNSWLESDQEKINLLTGVLDKIRAYDGEFISTVLTDVVDLLDSVLFQFPGIDTNNDGVTDITLSDFLERINEMTVILNKDPEYHSWFQGALSKVADLALLEVGFNPMVDFGVIMLASGENAFTDEELEILYEVIEQNFASNEDLKREL